MRQHRFIKASKEEVELLKSQLKKPMSRQESVRIEGLLLSIKGYTMEQIVDILEVNRDTISRWFNRWDQGKMNNLANLPKSGRRRIYTETEEKK
ncbi:helix-turn-helix domain-containing protein [Chondrinema litorale]|uniref:helix-turn-helix domain-containing protein n=1 Tax=Chondrinema litorale TaxID=2994555 RepID=UPI002543D9D0|nr:helix-turn-helix domain-containing protein [Chondrinema litorale]UZR99979.1 helix-turn-helix domain-containing protein [Chondrinema litorale]